jgi:dCMP deaminase
MRYLTEEESKEAEKHILVAVEEAKKSTCKKSQRGAVIVKNGEIIGKGHNKVTIEELCDTCIREHITDNSRVELCSALHAEQLAILDALKKGKDLEGSRIFHIKVKNGKIKPSEDVSCTVCSRLVLEAGISEFVLLNKKGLALYSAEEFNRKSFEYFLK